MATQTVEFSAASGQTVTAKLFSAGSDTVVQTASAVTEATNRKGVFVATFTDVAAGSYRLIATNPGGTVLAQWWVDLTLTTSTFQAYEMPVSVVQSLSTSGANAARDAVWNALPSAGYVDESFGDRIVVSNSNQRTVQITGSNHIAADVHEFQTGVITETDFADNAISARVIAADAVNEIQAGLATLANQVTIIGYLDTEISAIKAVTDKLNTGLVADGLLYQFTANMLELAPGGGGGSGDASQTTLLEVQDTVDAIAASLSGVPITASGRVADGGVITIYCGDDLRVRSGSEITLQVTDIGGAIFTRLDSIGTSNLFFGAAKRGLPASAISGDINSITAVGSGSTQTVEIVVEIADAGETLQPSEDYLWQIESIQDHGTESDRVVEMEGGLILRRRVVRA